jgi:hypothetical protein
VRPGVELDRRQTEHERCGSGIGEIDMDDLDFAKILLNTGESSGRTKDDFHREIEKRAAEIRRAGESPQQSYTRYVTEMPEGRILLKAYRVAPHPKQAPQDFVERRNVPKGPAGKGMDAMIRELRRSKNLSYEQALSRIAQDRKELLAAIRREEIEATAAVRQSREPVFDTKFDEDWRLGNHGDRVHY